MIKAERRAPATKPSDGPPFDDGGESAYFLSVNRNKTRRAPRSTCPAPADRGVLIGWLKEADRDRPGYDFLTQAESGWNVDHRRARRRADESRCCARGAHSRGDSFPPAEHLYFTVQNATREVRCFLSITSSNQWQVEGVVRPVQVYPASEKRITLAP